MRLVFLDSGPLGMIANPKGKSRAVQCQQWARGLLVAGVRVFVPEIADFEVRRKLLHLGATASIARLDRLRIGFDYAPITTDAMLKAAELWAEVRRSGLPTASPDALDADCIIAAQALLAAGPDDSVVVATENVGHLARLCDARSWDSIA